MSNEFNTWLIILSTMSIAGVSCVGIFFLYFNITHDLLFSLALAGMFSGAIGLILYPDKNRLENDKSKKRLKK